MPIREYLILTTESTYGAYNSSGTVVNIPLDGSNAFKAIPKPVTYSIRSAASLNKRFIRGTQKTKVGATLTTDLYSEQAATLLGWATTEINSGQTSPWTTTEPVGDLASATLDHAIMRGDGTFRMKRYLGCKVKTWRLSCDNHGDLTKIALGISVQKYQGNSYDSSSDPSLTAPAISAFPVAVYAFQHTAGNLTIASARTNFTSLSISGENIVQEPFDEGHFISRCRYKGRNIDFQVNLESKSTPDDFTTYLTQAAVSAQVEWVNGAHSVTVNFEGSNYVDEYGEDHPLDADMYYDLHLQNYLSATAGTDLAITVV